MSLSSSEDYEYTSEEHLWVHGVMYVYSCETGIWYTHVPGTQQRVEPGIDDATMEAMYKEDRASKQRSASFFDCLVPDDHPKKKRGEEALPLVTVMGRTKGSKATEEGLPHAGIVMQVMIETRSSSSVMKVIILRNAA